MNHAVNKSRTKPETWVKQPSKQYMDGPQARLTIERHLALGSAGQHASVSVSGLGILSLPLRPLFPNRLVTGVLGYACLGTCVFRLTSLLPWVRIFQAEKTWVQDCVIAKSGVDVSLTHRHEGMCDVLARPGRALPGACHALKCLRPLR